MKNGGKLWKIVKNEGKLQENEGKLWMWGGPIGPRHIIPHFHHYRYHNKLKKERDNKVSPFLFLFLEQSVIRQFHLLLVLREHFIIQ